MTVDDWTVANSRIDSPVPVLNVQSRMPSELLPDPVDLLCIDFLLCVVEGLSLPSL